MWRKRHIGWAPMLPFDNCLHGGESHFIRGNLRGTASVDGPTGLCGAAFLTVAGRRARLRFQRVFGTNHLALLSC
jgi:hypothetical protein